MITVEDGSGLTNSNSYVTLEEANAYFTAKGVVLTLTDETLVNATQYVDVTYSNSFNGKKATFEQALEWPRSTFWSTQGFRIESFTIPKVLKTAVFEAARLATTQDLFDTSSNENDNIISKTQSVEGAVSQSITYSSPTKQNPKAGIARFMSSILVSGFNQITRVK